jgi:hypothetical protein
MSPPAPGHVWYTNRLYIKVVEKRAKDVGGGVGDVVRVGRAPLGGCVGVMLMGRVWGGGWGWACCCCCCCCCCKKPSKWFLVFTASHEILNNESEKTMDS